jgi:hypothetical protein
LTVDRFRIGWLKGTFMRGSTSRRYSRDTYPEPYITEYILIYEDKSVLVTQAFGHDPSVY